MALVYEEIAVLPDNGMPGVLPGLVSAPESKSLIDASRRCSVQPAVPKCVRSGHYAAGSTRPRRKRLQGFVIKFGIIAMNQGRSVSTRSCGAKLEKSAERTLASSCSAF